MVGGNSGDTTCRASDASPATPKSHEALQTLLRSYFFEDTEFLLAPYYNDTKSPQEIFFQMSRDAGVICPTSRFARRFLERDGNVFTYFFSYNATGPSVYHGGEIHCIFQNVSSSNQEEKSLCHIAGLDWSEFIRTHNPPYDSYPSSYRQYELDGKVETTNDLYDRIGMCRSLWDKYIARGKVEESRVDSFGYIC